MKIKVVLDEGDVVDDWFVFRLAFERAAREMDLRLTEIVHAKEEL